jgi:hypothetical protein
MSLIWIKKLTSKSPPGLIGAIIQGAWVGTFVSCVLVCAVYLVLVIFDRLKSDVVQDYEAFAFLLLWFPVQIMLGLGFLIVAVPAWWLLFISKHRGVLDAVILGVVLGFVFSILVWAAPTLVTEHSANFWEYWWMPTLTKAAAQAFAGGITGWFVLRTVSRSGLI